MTWTISPDFSSGSYRLNPRFCHTRFFGAGFTTQSTTTADGKTLAQLLADSVHVCTWNMETGSQNAWGTIASPSTYAQYGIAIQDAIIAAGGGWGLKIGMGPRGLGSYVYPTATDPINASWNPYTIPSNQAIDSDTKPFSLNWLKNWLTWAVARWGESFAEMVVLDNEWFSRTLSTSGGYDPGWYLGSDGWNCQDWATANSRYYTAAAQEIISGIPCYGFSFVDGARASLVEFRDIYLKRWLFGTGWTNWPHGSDDNTDQSELHTCTHGYGTSVSVGSGNSATTVSAAIRAYIQVYCANHNAYRLLVPSNHKFFAEESWFTRKTMTSTDTTGQSREALGHLVFYMISAANAEAWNQQGHLFWGVGPVDFPSAGGGSPESWIMTSGGKIIRLPAYYVIRDICKKAVDAYPIVVDSNSIQINTDGLLWLTQKALDGATGCIIIVNSSTVTQNLSVTGFNSITKVQQLPTTLAIDTGLTNLGTTIPATIAVNEALFIEGTLTSPPPPASFESAIWLPQKTHASSGGSAY